jgi:autotransporter translocation and assembly factor TamB
VVTIQNASFRVEPTGVVYTGLDGRIDLQNDRVHIDHIRVLDNQRKPLSVTGDLAVHELEVGAFNVAVKADDFKVIDNDMGNVRVLRRPRVEGDLGVSTGVINLDPILAPSATRRTTPSRSST